MVRKLDVMLAVLFTLVLSVGAISAATLIVGKPNTPCPRAQYATITGAINAASSGDTIQICPALYPEQLTITKPLTLMGIEVNGIKRILVQPSIMVPSPGLDGAVG